MKKLVALLFWIIPALAYSIDWNDSPEVEAVFQDAGVRGTFVLYDATGQKMVGFNRRRAETRFVPASTFKIPNTLVGLSAGAVRDVDEVLPYGGKPQPYSVWEQDMALRDAIRISSVPIYQELARRIGAEAMAVNLEALQYGNAEVGKVVDGFWLDGPLKISAVEQARFLARLARGQLPFPAGDQAQVREITLLESGDGWSLHGKTGLTGSFDPDIGWWVGWVEKGGHVYTFALNLDIAERSDASKRVQLGRASLEALGIL